MKSGEQLCLACGLCCDGSLFGHVRLGPGDDARRLRGLGLPVTRTRGRDVVTRFPQPCAALCADRACRLYADRPAQCRDFECGVFAAAQAGRMEFPAALRLVRQARRRADTIRALLRQLGDSAEHAALDERFQRMQTRMETRGADGAQADAFAKLSVAMHRFQLLAHGKFHTKAGPK